MLKLGLLNKTKNLLLYISYILKNGISFPIIWKIETKINVYIDGEESVDLDKIKKYGALNKTKLYLKWSQKLDIIGELLLCS